MTHKYDHGAYTVLLFDHLGRKTGEKNANSFTEASELGKKHDGSYTVIRCITNSAQRTAPWMPRDERYEREATKYDERKRVESPPVDC